MSPKSTDPVFVISITDQNSSKASEAPSTDIEVQLPLAAEPQRWKRNQYLASLAANFGALQFGTYIGWSATALPYLRKDARFHITTITEESWIGSMILIGALISGPIGGYSNERLGRRLTMLLLTGPCVLGWLLIFFAQNLEMIYAGRLLLGFTGGAFAVVAPVYVAETSDPDVRGKLSSGFDMGIATGILYVQVIGAYVSWKWQTLASAVLVIFGHLLLMIVPESPRYLASKDKFDEAKRSLCWLKNTQNSELVEGELSELKGIMAEQKVKDEASNSFTVLFQPHILKPCLVTLFIHLISSLTAVNPINAYTVDIFVSAGTHLDEFMCTVVFGVVGAVASVFTAMVVDKLGRRPILILTQLLMAGSLGTMGIFYFLKKQNGGVSLPSLDWLPLASLSVFIAAFAGGTGPISYMIQGEILPPEAKGVALSAITTVKWVSSFLTSRFFLDILFILGEDCGYWLFAGFCFLGAVYIMIYVPETKGKTLEQIQLEYLNNSKRNVISNK